jgi:hypothetical protein
MAKKKLSPLEHLSLIIKSKRGAIIALIGAIATVEAMTPGTMASFIGEQWATKVMALIGVAVAATKVVDNTKAE